MDTRKIPVFCYWNGCIKDGPDGPFYEGSSLRVIRVESRIELSLLLDDLHRVTGLEKGKFQIDLIGRYPSIVQPSMVKYMRLPVVDDCSLETMLEVPSYHPSINNVDFYLEVKPVSEPLSHPLPVANNVSSSENQATRKRFRTDDANVDAVVNVSVSGNGGNNEAVQENTNLEWQYDPFPKSKDASFRSVFWAFQQSIEGFPYCRPLIIVDTVDLSGKYRGKILVAAGFDAENKIFPLAFAISTEESLSAGTWRWFFSCIRKKVTQREGLCLITSPCPDIVAVVNEPDCQWAQHRFCLRQLCCKFYDVFQNNLMTELVYKAASASDISRFDFYLKKIEKMNPEARRWLDKLPLHQWTLARDVGGLRFGVLSTNTIARTYDFINKARNLPITTCILLILDHLAELFKLRDDLLKESLKDRREVYAKHVMEKLEEYKVTSMTHDVLHLDQSGQRFQVTEEMQDGKKKLLVYRSDRACTCGIWQLYKYPCPHVLAVCSRLNIDHLEYVNDFYKIKSSLGVYAADFKSLPGVSDWPEASDIPRLFPPGYIRAIGQKAQQLSSAK